MSAEKFDFRSDFNTAGVFWEPSKPDQKFSAQIISKRSHIDLTVAAESFKVTVETVVTERQGNTADPTVLNGFTGLGRCSLLHLHSIGNPGLLNLPEGWEIRAPKYRVSACVAGLHMDSASAAIFKEAEFRFKGLDGWFQPSVELSFDERGVSVLYPKNVPPVVDCGIERLAVQLKIRVSPGAKFSSGGVHTARPQAYITITSEECHELDWFLSIGVRLERYFSLCLGTSVALTSMYLKTDKDQECSLIVRGGRSKHQTPDVRYWIRCDAQDLQRTISAWLNTPEELEPVEVLLYETIRRTKLFVETEFLALAQAFESFHRVTDKSTLIAGAEFAEVMERLREFIAQTVGQPILAERLVSSMEHANEPSFRNRIFALFERLKPETLQRLLKENPETFERTLRQTRNYFTHAGTKKKRRVLTDSGDVFLFNQKLHALLRLLLLIRIGFPEEKAIDGVEQQVLRFGISRRGFSLK
jgi:hypothetical protein